MMEFEQRVGGPRPHRRPGPFPVTKRARGRRNSLAVVLAAVAQSACGGSPPPTLGPQMDRLAPCPATPNCVNTGDRHPEGTAAFYLDTDQSDAFARIVDIVENMPRMSVVTATGTYLHAEEHSRIFRFVDDVEILLARGGELIVRSASRIGSGDMGVNARRVEKLRELLTEAGLLRAGSAPGGSP